MSPQNQQIYQNGIGLAWLGFLADAFSYAGIVSYIINALIAAWSLVVLYWIQTIATHAHCAKGVWFKCAWNSIFSLYRMRPQKKYFFLWTYFSFTAMAKLNFNNFKCLYAHVCVCDWVCALIYRSMNKYASCIKLMILCGKMLKVFISMKLSPVPSFCIIDAQVHSISIFFSLPLLISKIRFFSSINWVKWSIQSKRFILMYLNFEPKNDWEIGKCISPHEQKWNRIMV